MHTAVDREKVSLLEYRYVDIAARIRVCEFGGREGLFAAPSSLLGASFRPQLRLPLRTAKVRYPMILANRTVTLRKQLLGDNQTTDMLYPPPEDTDIGSENSSTIGGIMQAAVEISSALSSVSPTGDGFTRGSIAHA